MTRARCINCIFHHIHSTCSAITSTPPGFTPEFALQLLRLPCNPPSHGRAYHSSPPPLESRLCIHQAWPQLQNITSSQGFPRVFNSVDRKRKRLIFFFSFSHSTTHQCIRRARNALHLRASPGMRFNSPEASDFCSGYHLRIARADTGGRRG